MKDYMYLRSDLRLLLGAIALAAQNANRSDEYNEGFSDALRSVAAGVGLEEMPQQPQRTQTITIEQPQRTRLGGGR